jgi:seryl-tRNA synthetase
MSIGVESVGKEVLCPKCGKMGKVSTFHTYAKGFKYTYLVVEHEEKYKDKKTKRKCVIKLIGKEKVEKVLRKEEAKPIEAYVVLPEYEKLKEENARLREENVRLKQENEQLRMALQNIYNARIAQAREKERKLVETKYMRRKGSELSEEEGKLAYNIMKALLNTDWVAVRFDVFEEAMEAVRLGR